jgi:aspartyl-tRNA(Asn)/glutamyl-tRNA(Gln) amidotransferase subunit C
MAGMPDSPPHDASVAPTRQISREDVAHLAGLARIQLDDAELDRLGRELPKILESVATVSQALEGAGDVAPMSHPTPLSNVFREDVVHRSLTPEEALAAAPAREGQRFLVPKILGEE